MDNVPDEKDRVLLRQLQRDARLTSAELGKLVGLSASGVHKRLRKLDESGIVRQYPELLDRNQYIKRWLSSPAKWTPILG